MVSLGLLVVVLQILIAMLRNTLLEVSPNCQWDSAAAKSSWILLCTKYCWKSLLMFRWSGSIKTVEPRLHETLWKGRSSQALPLPADRSRLPGCKTNTFENILFDFFHLDPFGHWHFHVSVQLGRNLDRQSDLVAQHGPKWPFGSLAVASVLRALGTWRFWWLLWSLLMLDICWLNASTALETSDQCWHANDGKVLRLSARRIQLAAFRAGILNGLFISCCFHVNVF